MILRMPEIAPSSSVALTRPDLPSVKREPASDTSTHCNVDSLKVLDPERPIREADVSQRGYRRHMLASQGLPFRYFAAAIGARHGREVRGAFQTRCEVAEFGKGPISGP
jgi:hypothetical protein